MLPVFLYWFHLQIKGKTVFPRWMAFTNVLVIFALLKGISLLMPFGAFRLGFTNGLMSESMVIVSASRVSDNPQLPPLPEDFRIIPSDW